MVLEQFLDRKFVVQHTFFVFILSAVYVFISYAVQTLFFPADSGLAIVLLATILLVPSLHHLVVMEEKLESKGASYFWKRHRTIIQCYIGAFLGLLTGFLVMGFMVQGSLGFQQQQLLQEHLKPEIITSFLEQPYVPDIQTTMALFSHNLMYLLIGFVLSVFYGAGAIFLVTYNASFFAAFVVELFNRWAVAGQLATISLLHLLPESAGYILTAIAGAEISRALIHEKLTGDPFRNVLKNCFMMMIYAILLILLAAFLETYVTAPFFHSAI